MKVLRYSDDGKSTAGLLFVNGKFFAHTIEDEHRDVKVKGETCIPDGKYKLKILKQDTPLTIKHRQTYGSWFKYHIEITNVPNFQGVYIHAGNNESHTEGCLLIGKAATKDGSGQTIQRSIEAIKEFYLLVYPLLEKGEEVTIEMKTIA